jgi:hypothetical protein
MKPSEKIKLLGFKSLEEAAVSAGETRLNLIRWSKTYPRRFELILKGLVFERMNDQLNEIFDGIEEDEEGFE